MKKALFIARIGSGEPARAVFHLRESEKKRMGAKNGTHKEVLRHSISDVRSEVLWRFY